MDAELHLVEAAKFIRQGENFYRRAADEIAAAMREDPTLGYPRIAERVGKSAQWCRDIVRWRTNSHDPLPTPFAGQYESRSDNAARQAVRERPEVIADALRDAPESVREQIAAALPPRPVLPGTVGAMEAEYGPLPAPPASRLAAVLRIASDVEDLRERVEELGIEDTDTMALRSAHRACEAAADAFLVINAAVVEVLNERTSVEG